MFDDISGYCTSIRQDADGYVAVLKPEYAVDGMRTLLWRDDGWVTINGAHVFIDDKGIVRGGAGGKFNGRNMSKDARSWYKKKQKFLKYRKLAAKDKYGFASEKDVKAKASAREKAERDYEYYNKEYENSKTKKSKQFYYDVKMNDIKAFKNDYQKLKDEFNKRKEIIEKYKNAVKSGASKSDIDRIVFSGQMQRQDLDRKFGALLVSVGRKEKENFIRKHLGKEPGAWYTLNADIEKACIDGKADIELLVKTHIANELRSARKKLNSNGARGEAIRARAKAKAELEKAKKAENKTRASYEEFKQWQQVQALEKAKDDKARAKGGDAMANRVYKKARRELYTGPNGPVKPYIDDIKKIAKEEGVTMGVAQEIHKGRVARHMAEYYKSFNGRNTGDSADDIVIPF